MIIARAPLRITLGGGGTDIPAYYEKHGGLCLAAAIDKYVYITIHETFVPELIVKYSKLERVRDASQLEHPIIREAFALCGLSGSGMEVTSMADIPAGTGLGSSGSFTVALLKALHAYKHEFASQAQLAEEACEIEINRLREPIGKQDQYIASFGGVTRFDINNQGGVTPTPIASDLDGLLFLFFTGYSRSASAILANQTQALKQDDRDASESLHFAKACANESFKALVGGDYVSFASILDRHWQHKKARGGMSNPEIDRL